ncbi:MAG: TIGR04086 family membrane protein, partial [Clostridiales bacterium]
SLLIYYTSISQQSLTLAAAIINSLALFCGGFAAGRKSGAKGLIQGLIVGTIVVIIMMLLGGITAGFLPRLSYCLIAAMIGGIFGVK